MASYPANWSSWRHITKLDPDRSLTDDEIKFICHSGTDALIIGGTQGIEGPKIRALLNRLAPFTLPKVIEVSSPEAIVPGADLYLIPVVLNGGDPRWLIGAHQEAVQTWGPLINWQQLVPEGYIILNPSSQAAQLTKALHPESPDAAAAYAACGEKLFNLPIIYLEYSGAYGDPALVQLVRKQIKKSRLFYGGGIDCSSKAYEMGLWADTLVIGNMIYEGKLHHLPDTVRAAQESYADTIA